MEIGTWITAVAEQGELLAKATEKTAPDTPVPSCPEWRMRDLVRHTGHVHRWVEAIVRERRASNTSQDRAEILAGVVDPTDDDAAAWLRDGVDALVRTLRGAPEDLECVTFMPAPTPLAFWARRQAHETAIHRVDAELAAGVLTPTDRELATDGIDELILGFIGSRGESMRTERAASLLVSCAQRHWLVRFTPDGTTAQRTDEPVAADCTVTGPPSAAYLTLWNRGPWDELDVAGDASAVDLWSRQVRIGARR